MHNFISCLINHVLKIVGYMRVELILYRYVICILPVKSEKASVSLPAPATLYTKDGWKEQSRIPDEREY